MVIQSLAMRTIRVARRLVVNTPIQRWPVTTAVYRWVFRRVSPPGDVTTDVHGVRLTFPAHDITIAPGLLGGFYEQLEVDAFVRLAKISRGILDVGGNLGLYACLGGRELPAGGKLVAFEPVPDNLEYLRRNIAQNPSAGQVVVEPVAVGDTEGTITVHLSMTNTGTHSVSADNVGPSRRSIDVPLTSIDAYLTANPVETVDLIKIDVEGNDGAVLRGAADTLKRHTPTLFVEYGPGHLRNCGFDPDEFLDIVFANYDCVLLVDEPRRTVRRCTRPELARLGRKKIMMNLVCVRREDHLAALAPIG